MSRSTPSPWTSGAMCVARRRPASWSPNFLRALERTLPDPARIFHALIRARRQAGRLRQPLSVSGRSAFVGQPSDSRPGRLGAKTASAPDPGQDPDVWSAVLGGPKPSGLRTASRSAAHSGTTRSAAAATGPARGRTTHRVQGVRRGRARRHGRPAKAGLRPRRFSRDVRVGEALRRLRGIQDCFEGPLSDQHQTGTAEVRHRRLPIRATDEPWRNSTRLYARGPPPVRSRRDEFRDQAGSAVASLLSRTGRAIARSAGPDRGLPRRPSDRLHLGADRWAGLSLPVHGHGLQSEHRDRSLFQPGLSRRWITPSDPARG